MKLPKFIRKLGRRALEPTTIAGAAGVPTVAAVAAVVLPEHAGTILTVAPLFAGLLIGHKPRRTFEAEAND